MEQYRRQNIEIGNEKTTLEEPFRIDSTVGELVKQKPESRVVSAKEIATRHLQEKEATIRRRKWIGRGLIFFGISTLTASCPLYAFALIGPQTIAAGLALVLSGTGLIAWKPKLKDTNEALLVAVKHGNYLTVPRLALEMDISFEKAEKIITELVKSGIAEIDFDRKEPDNALVYRIKGL